MTKILNGKALYLFPFNHQQKVYECPYSRETGDHQKQDFYHTKERKHGLSSQNPFFPL